MLVYHFVSLPARLWLCSWACWVGPVPSIGVVALAEDKEEEAYHHKKKEVASLNFSLEIELSNFFIASN